MAEDFRWALTAFPAGEYEALLTELLDRGYVPVALDNLDRNKRHMFIRHDVDLCPEKALDMARREQALGVRSTYYFLVSTKLYSVSAAATRRILEEITGLGHKIGLHFDATQYVEQVSDLDAAAAQECEILAFASQSPISSISFHRPAKILLNRPARIAGRRHCYEPAFFTDIGYIADSNGGWYHGHPLDHVAVTEGRAIQLLTHPIWWCNSEPMSTVETVDRFFESRRDALKEALAGTITAYRQALENRDS